MGFTMKNTLCAALLLAGTLAAAGEHGEHHAHWGYTGHEGPESWGTLSPDYHTCGVGMNQSPIDITSSVDANLPAIGFRYYSASSEILNNGHTVQVNVKEGSSIFIDGVSYELKQYHFHTPSENHIHGMEFPLEVHFVHADKDGNLAVVAVMFEEGAANPQLAQLWADMPMHAGDHHALNGEVKDLNALLPKEREYYRFNGSLTTPPCTEGVKWMVLKSPLTISKGQVETFAHAVHGHNNRPVQGLHARVIVR